MNKKLKKNILTLHKILGLATGVVVFIVAITGGCWVVKDEIESLYEPDFAVEKQEAPMLTPTHAKEMAKGVIPSKTIHGTLCRNNAEAVAVIFYDEEPQFYQRVILHRYSGDVS